MFQSIYSWKVLWKNANVGIGRCTSKVSIHLFMEGTLEGFRPRKTTN